MRRLLLLAVAACAHAHPSTESFDALSKRVLADFYHANPVYAVSLGYHEFDGQTSDNTPAGFAAQQKMLHADEDTLAHYEPKTPLEREDRDTLLVMLRGASFYNDVLDATHTNPMAPAADITLDAYILRDYAEAPVRAAAIVKLCTHVPAYLEQARKNLQLPAPKPWLETAVMMFKGFDEFANKDVREAFPNPPADLGPALDTCHKAFADHAAWLEKQLPTATDKFALGADHFIAMLAAIDGIHIDLARLEQIANADLDRNTKAIEAAAREIDPKRAVADVVADVLKERPAADAVISTATKQAADLRQFLIDKHIVTVPGDEIAVPAPTPSFARWNAASLTSPGTFEPKSLPSFYYITPPDPKWTPEEQAQYIPPTITLLFTTVHEVYPGHFVNWLHMKRSPSTVLKSFWDYATGEGWAHYTEEMMYDAGAGGHTPQAHVGQLVEALLRNVRFVVAIGEHTKGMTVEQATKLFQERAFLDPGNARQQAVRGTFDPMYLAYTVGKLAIMKLRTDWMAKHPTATLQEFHDAFLSHGTAPMPVIRRAMMDDDAVL